MEYKWKLGDVFTNGQYRWQVVEVVGETALLQSLSTSWAKTRLLTYAEWNEDGSWQLDIGDGAYVSRDEYKKNVPALLACLLLSGCSLAYVPTAPTETVTAAVLAPEPVRLALVATPDFNGLTLSLSAFDAFGKPTPLDASCTASSGRIDPQRIVSNGAASARWTGAAPRMGSVTCRTGILETTLSVDLAAWTVSFGQFREELFGAFITERRDPLQWWTFTSLVLMPRSGQPISPASMVVSWGDGFIERIDGALVRSALTRSVGHVYARPGAYAVLARVEWEGGAAEVRGTVTRVCIANGPASPQEPGGYGYCSNAFREER